MNREQIKKWRDDPYGATGKYGMTRADFKQLCDLALRGLEAGEPVAWCVGYDDPGCGLILSNPTMRKEDAETTIKKAVGKLRLIPLTYASAPSGMVAVPIKFLRKVFMFLKQDCTPCAATDCQIDGKNLNVDALADELQALLSADPEVKP